MKPKIRIKGFNDAWEYSYLYNCLEISTEVNKENKYGKDEVLSVSDDFGVVNQIKHLGRSYAGKSVSGYKILLPGQIVYTKSPLRDKPFGIIKENNYQAGIVSVLYAVYNVKEGIFSKYIQRYFEPKQRINKYLVPLVNKGAKNTMNISDEMSLNGKITKPVTICEQQAICIYFDKVDELISTASSRLASLKQVKGASLQAMFPKKGENVPKIRFKGFEGEWEEILLGSLFSERVENDVTAEMLSVTMHDGIIKANENGRYDNSNSDRSNYKLVLKDDIAYNTMRMWQGASGCSPYSRGIVSPAYTVITPNVGVCSVFFAFYFKTNGLINKFRLNSQGLTKDTWNLKYPAFSSISVLYPTNVLEQQRIASYFTSLDKQIALQMQRLEKLKQIKAACLDKMFV